MTVAIMQPYFVPYAGYFRLFAASDLFVIYDCVQFPRRGWVHRNRMPDGTGTDRWLTLPLTKASREVQIHDLRFVPDATCVWEERLRSVPLMAPARGADPDIVAAVRDLRGTPVEYIERLLHHAVARLGMRWEVRRSSAMNLPDTLRGQARLLEICRRVGATRYVNSPNGRSLYDASAFEAAGIELRFLNEYPGSFTSILRRLVEEQATTVAEEIRAASQTEPAR